MKTEEANKIIAEYMGKAEVYAGDIFMGYTNMRAGQLFTESLDALKPVWDAMRIKDVEFCWFSQQKVWTVIINRHAESVLIEGDTITEAAAIATAKAIIEKKDE